MFFKKCTIRSLAYLLLMLQGLDELHAQTNNFTYKLSLDSVSFAGTGLIRIRNDDNTFFYDAPHWTTRLANPKPVGYRSGVKPNVRSAFKIEGVCNTAIFVKGEGPNGITFPAQQLRLNAARTNAVYDFVESNIAFENEKVNYFENFGITWYYAETANATRWVKIGASTNKMYVTKGRPLRIYDITENNVSVDTATFHTVINIGCKHATGETNDSVIVAKIYKEFQKLNISSIDNRRPLQYWGNSYGSPYILSIPNGNIDDIYFTKGLLKHSEGTCNAWSLFFIEILRTQGIGDAEFSVLTWTSTEKLGATNARMLAGDLRSQGLIATNINDLSLLPAKFFVKNWDTDYPLYLLNGYNNQRYRPGQLIADTDKQGVKGQNMENPWSIFQTHVIVRYKGVHYDPSYGSKPTKVLAELQNNSLSFFGTLVEAKEIDVRNGRTDWYIWTKPFSANDKLLLKVEPQHQ